MQYADTIIISDIQLGTSRCRADKLTEVLKNWKFDRLIILGDLFDHENLIKLNSKHWEFLDYIKNLSTNTDIIWIEGNHDQQFQKVIPHLMNIKVFPEYTWEYKGRNYLALHGHQFDNFLTKNKLLLRWAAIVYSKMQELDRQSFKFSKVIQKSATMFFSSSSNLAKNAVSYGFKKGFEYVICGHTHKPIYQRINDVHYYNAGCWTEFPSSLISISSKGTYLHTFH